MRRIRLAVAAAATIVAMLTFSIPAIADVDFDGDRHGDRYEDRIDDYYDALEEAYEDGLFYYNSFGVYGFDEIEDIDIEYIEDHWDLD
jgi:hypothetical protein